MGHADRTRSEKGPFTEQLSTPQNTAIEEPMKVITKQPTLTANNSKKNITGS